MYSVRCSLFVNYVTSVNQIANGRQRVEELKVDQHYVQANTRKHSHLSVHSNHVRFVPKQF